MRVGEFDDKFAVSSEGVEVAGKDGEPNIGRCFDRGDGALGDTHALSDVGLGAAERVAHVGEAFGLEAARVLHGGGFSFECVLLCVGAGG